MEHVLDLTPETIEILKKAQGSEQVVSPTSFFIAALQDQESFTHQICSKLKVHIPDAVSTRWAVLLRYPAAVFRTG